MAEKKIEVIKNWPEPQSIKDIQVFLGFANLYRRFIKNFDRIAALLTSILQTINDKPLNTQATENKNWDISAGAGSAGGAAGGASGADGGIDRNIKNLSTTIKFAKTKKSANSPRTNFLTFEAKKIFIHL